MRRCIACPTGAAAAVVSRQRMARERMLRALALAWCLAALTTRVAIAQAYMAMEASQVQFLHDCKRTWNWYFDDWQEQRIQEGINCEYDDYGNLLYCDNGFIEGIFCELAGLYCDANGMILKL
ncbi:unnamed protein product [Closterium sp. NIES-64]|nr:unnamed protein product [Closterium sp. NIES-64]